MNRAARWLIAPVSLLVGLGVALGADSAVPGMVAGAVTSTILVVVVKVYVYGGIRPRA